MKAFTLIELFPLPSPDTGAWSYGPLAEQLPYLINRDTYRHTVFSARADTLRQKLATYKPVAVLCYSKIYRELFEGVIGQRFPTQIDALGVARIVLGTTQIFLCDHVVAVGTRNARLTAIGQYIQNCLTPSQRNLL